MEITEQKITDLHFPGGQPPVRGKAFTIKLHAQNLELANARQGKNKSVETKLT
jgi:hypothetical protein